MSFGSRRRVRRLGMKRGVPDPSNIDSARRSIAGLAPGHRLDLDVSRGFTRRAGCEACGTGSVVWGIRQSDLDPIHSKRMTRMMPRLCARLSSRVPDRIVSCSRQAVRVHVDMGHAAERMIIIPNLSA